MTAFGGLGGNGRAGVSSGGSGFADKGNVGGDSSGDGTAVKGSPSGGVANFSVSYNEVSTSGFCPLFGGGVIYKVGATGTSGTMYGEGGGSIFHFGSTANYAGGSGGPGVVIITESF